VALTRVLSAHVVKGRGKVVAVELGADCALCVVGGSVTHDGDRYVIAGVERHRVNRELRPGDRVGLLLRPEPWWGEGAEVEFAGETP
jgi:hypothetical protein